MRRLIGQKKKYTIKNKKSWKGKKKKEKKWGKKFRGSLNLQCNTVRIIRLKNH